ncbi:MAG: leucine-rich repeat protein [Bacteroidales bacterium]|nr:leucine-rich repeat protein [Bacteroidales bacterium]
MKIKLLLLVFTVVFITTNLQAADFTMDGIAYTIISATAPYTVAVSKKSPVYTGTVTIPASVGYNSINYSVTSIGEHAFQSCTGLTAVTIPNSVSFIGKYAFYNCTGLTTVVLPNLVTSIGNYTFQNCSGLTSVTIPNSVIYIGDYAFDACSGLTSVAIPNSVTSIGYGAFQNCAGLTSVTIPISITSIGDHAFYKCTGLTSVTIPNSVTSIEDYAFYNCIGLTSLILPNSITSIGDYAFNGCSSLASVNIPNSVTYIWGYAFNGCSGLTSVFLPNSVTFIGTCAFNGCTGLTSIYACRLTPINFYSNWGIFDNVDKTTCTLYVPIDSKSLYTAAYQWEDFTNIEEISTAGFMVDGIAYYITSSTSPKTVEVAAGGTYTGVVTIPASVSCNSTSYSVTSIGNYAFNQCAGLSSINIPGSVTSIGNYAFCGCTGLTSTTIPSSVKSIGKYAFTLNSCLFYVEGNNSNFSSKDDVLYNKDQTKLIQCPASKSGSFAIPSSVTSIGDGAFESCSGLSSLILPNSVTYIGNYAFESCTGLTSFTIPNSVTYIGNNAFYKCTGLTSVTITALAITLPNSVTTIGDYAFDKCTSLISLYANNSTPINIRLNSDANYTGFNAAITLYVPIGSKSLYAAAPVWKDFKYIVEHVVTGIAEVSASKLNIWATGRTLEISLPETSAPVLVVDISGRQLYNGTPTGSTFTFTLPLAGIYLVRIGNKVAKLFVP